MTVDVSETMALGTVLATVSATDGDGDIIKYTIEGDDVATQFFYMNPTSGIITLKTLLKSDNLAHTQYNVSVILHAVNS